LEDSTHLQKSVQADDFGEKTDSEHKNGDETFSDIEKRFEEFDKAEINDSTEYFRSAGDRDKNIKFGS
jgi:hypothetical protein